MSDIELKNELYEALCNGDAEVFRRRLIEFPNIATQSRGESWLEKAASKGVLEIVQLMVEAGSMINQPFSPPLERAIDSGHIEIVRYLLDNGADLKFLDRPLISAINSGSKAPDNSMVLVRLLVEAGADINKHLNFGGPDGPIFNAVSWAKNSDRADIYDYLVSHGGVEPSVVYRPRKPTPLDEEIIAHFQATHGTSQLLEWMDIIPRTPWVSVHVIPPTPGRPLQTLFTTGVSSVETFIPEELDPDSAELYRYAELFIDVPADWDVSATGLARPQFGWLIRELQHLGQTAYQSQEWFGDDSMIFANDDPPEPFADGIPFAAMMCQPDGHLVSSTGRRVQLYRVTPVTASERDYAQRMGCEALVERFGGALPKVLDVLRQSVVTAVG